MKSNSGLPLVSQSIANNLSVGDITSLAWRLYRQNFGKIVILNLIPTIIIFISKLLMNSVQFFGFSSKLMPVSCILYPIGVILLFFGFFSMLICSYPIFKILYNSLISQDISFKELFLDVKEDFVKIIILSAIISLQTVAFAVIFVILYIILIFIILLPVMLISMTGINNPILNLVACGLFSIIILLFLLMMLILMSLQLLSSFLPVQILIMEKIDALDAYVKSYLMIFKNFKKVILFGFLIFLVFFLIYSFFYSEVLTLALFFINPLELLKDANNFSTYYILIITLIASILGMTISPYIFSGITLFYYDIKTRTEGYDLFLILEQEKTKYYKTNEKGSNIA